MKTVSLTLVAAALVAALPAASAESVAPLAWTSCATSDSSTGEVAARTECARLTVPRDYANPAAGTLDLDVIRVVAAGERGERHDGSLLLEPDEFAGSMEQSIPAMASGWLNGDEGWRNVARRLDLVGLAQRRMDDARGHDCLSATSRLPRHASLGVVTTPSNFLLAENLALAVATACQNDPMHAHIGMRPRIEDIDRLREALGQSKMHLLAVGRGGWVAARYAERYPRNVGRMLLDSSWDADGSVAEAVEARVAERGRTIRRAVSAVVAAPVRYGWGADANLLHQRLGKLPSLAYSTWMGGVVDAYDLSAVLSLARMLEDGVAMSAQALRDTVAQTRMAIDTDDDRAVRDAAGHMLDRLDANEGDDHYGFGPRANGIAPALVASTLATRCNDGSWGTSQSYWRARVREWQEAWPSAAGSEAFQGMVCSEWPGAFGDSTVPVLDEVPRFLMLHAEFDDEAPLRNAAMMLNAHPNASMVVARGMRAHGIVIRQEQACVATAASQFLADGVLPAMKLTHCR